MLTKVDRATMAVSLEARVPLLDRAVVEFMARLPSSYKLHGWELKHLFKQSVKGLLPEKILKRKKEGFSIPVAQWLRDDLHDLMVDTLSSERIRSIGLLDEAVVAQTINAHLDRRFDHARELWSLLMFVLWHDNYVSGESQDESAPYSASA
jgi:asparagine synthase (glutamine-hydrolysing)